MNNSVSRVEYKTQCPRCVSKGRDRSGDNLAVYSDGHSYCFSCNYYIPPSHIERLRTEVLAREIQSVNNIDNNDLNFPKDYIPILDACDAFCKPAIGWLKRYGISNSEIQKHQMGWSKEQLLLIFPVFDKDKNLIMWQGRNFGEGPKYLNKGYKSDILHTVGKENQKVLIVSEDLLSSIKIGREYQAAPLWGCEMPLGLVKKASTAYETLGIWLDPDKSKKAVEIALRASQYIPTFIVNSSKDPKDYNLEAITQFIESAEHLDEKVCIHGVFVSPARCYECDLDTEEQGFKKIDPNKISHYEFNRCVKCGRDVRYIESCVYTTTCPLRV